MTDKQQTDMTPKEKAENLYWKYFQKVADGSYPESNAKQCALIAVDEILNTEPRYPSNVDWDDAGATHQYYYEAQIEEAARYWEQVKQEIEKL